MEQYVINNLDEFAEQARLIVFTNFGGDESVDQQDVGLIKDLSEEEQKDMDGLISHQECKTIIVSLAKKQTNKKTKEERFIISEKIFMQIIESINSRLVSNILAGLIKKGLIESAYDDKLNDFVFWVKDDENTKNNKESNPDFH